MRTLIVCREVFNIPHLKHCASAVLPSWAPGLGAQQEPSLLPAEWAAHPHLTQSMEMGRHEHQRIHPWATMGTPTAPSDPSGQHGDRL